MQIITLGSELLRQKAAKIEKIDGETEKTIGLMLEAMKKDKGVGLAGPQIGFMKRIFITRVEGDAERVFINPSILETSLETAKAEEGCLSIPGIYADVARAKSVKVQAWNEKGRPFTIEASGLMARVIQHEYDHLEGVLFLDRLPEEERNKLVTKYEKKAKKPQKKAKSKE
jgi:peptide deformylase